MDVEILRGRELEAGHTFTPISVCANMWHSVMGRFIIQLLVHGCMLVCGSCTSCRLREFKPPKLDMYMNSPPPPPTQPNFQSAYCML